MNPLIDSPPNKNIAKRTTKVVNEVFKVLLKVLFNAPSTIFLNSQVLLINLNSLIVASHVYENNRSNLALSQ